MSERVSGSYKFVNPSDFESNASTSSAIRPFPIKLMFTLLFYGVTQKTQLKFIFILSCASYVQEYIYKEYRISSK